MADSPTKKVRRRPPQTVRERSKQEENKAPKKRLVHSTARRAYKPLLAFGNAVAKVLQPLRFLLWPFKTRPARFIGRILAKVFFISYFRSSWQELKEVTWPGRRETLQLTMAVFMFAIAFGLLITVTDYGLDKVFKKVILQE